MSLSGVRCHQPPDDLASPAGPRRVRGIRARADSRTANPVGFDAYEARAARTPAIARVSKARPTSVQAQVRSCHPRVVKISCRVRDPRRAARDPCCFPAGVRCAYESAKHIAAPRPKAVMGAHRYQGNVECSMLRSACLGETIRKRSVPSPRRRPTTAPGRPHALVMRHPRSWRCDQGVGPLRASLDLLGPAGRKPIGAMPGIRVGGGEDQVPHNREPGDGPTGLAADQPANL